MAKRLKQRISRVFPSFQSCRSKDPKSLPESPVPAVFCLSPVNPKAVDIGFPTAGSRPRGMRSPAVVAVGCGCRPGIPDGGARSEQWRREEEWHVVAPRRKIDFSDQYDEETELSIEEERTRREEERQRRRRRKKKKKSYRIRCRLSSSSADSGWFSSEDRAADRYEEDDETETLFSSRSFSTDSSQVLKPIRESELVRRGKSMRRVKMGRRRSGGGRPKFGTPTCSASPETDAPGRVSVFRRLMPCSVEGKVRESFAVVKRSDDPYEDFRRSMMEMILEKQIFDAADLEQLLHCFLSLNSEAHHRVIVEAFSEIWEALFCNANDD